MRGLPASPVLLLGGGACKGCEGQHADARSPKVRKILKPREVKIFEKPYRLIFWNERKINNLRLKGLTGGHLGGSVQ